ncbi:PKD domain-containing protein, partial [Jejuia pallidilutea]|uniref:PKD domain-containing protein n=2 Tax=Jejuia pallidilutea TaxID=504487 RepID=UPI0005AA683E
PIISKIFVKPPEAFLTASTIVGYEYGFDDDNPPTYVPISPSKDANLITDIDVSALPNDVNVFYIRFKDDIGQWSPIISKIFVKPRTPENLTNNALVSLEYWFDNDLSTKKFIDIDPDASNYVLTEVNLNQLWAGEHTLHTQFKDVYNQYSAVMTDTIDKQVLPIASFVTNSNSICVGETINFTNNSIDYDTVTWNFDDGNTSSDFNTSHTFNTAGTYEVTLTVSESNSGLDSIATQNIQVYSIPVNTITASGPLQACFGSTVTLTADDANADYLWSTGATSRSIDVTANGTYNVTLTRTNSSGCSVVSDDIVITFNSEIDNSVTVYENSGDVQLTANQPEASYQWIDCSNGNTIIDGETNKTFTPTSNGEYAVKITVNNCTVTSNCQNITSLGVDEVSVYNFVKLYPNPVKDNLTLTTEFPLLIQICNINGMVLNTLKFESGVTNIDLKMLNNGLYFFKIKEISNTGSQRQGVFKILKH